MELGIFLAVIYSIIIFLAFTAAYVSIHWDRGFITGRRWKAAVCLLVHCRVFEESGVTRVQHRPIRDKNFQYGRLVSCEAIFPANAKQYRIHRAGRCPHCEYARYGGERHGDSYTLEPM